MKKITLVICALLLLLLLPCAVSAFTVTGVTVDPSGALTPGTSVNATCNVEFSSSFPPSDNLQMSTDIADPHWNYTLIVDSVEYVRPIHTGSTFEISGFELSYATSHTVSIRMILSGTIPSNPSTSQDLMKIQELDSSNNVISSSVYTLAMPVTFTPTPTPSYGSISVSSTPSGADVFLDNAYRGLTTLPMSGITNGDHVVMVRLSGYQDWTRNVTVLANSTSLTATLVATTNTTTTTPTPTPTPALNSTANGSIYVQSTPSISKVFLNNVYQGYTPMTLYNVTPGSPLVTVRRLDYNDWSQNVVVTAGNTTSITASLVLAPEVTTATVTAPTTTVTTVKTTAKSTVKVPTPWPSATATPAPASPVGVLVILGAVGVGFIVIRKW